MNPQTRGVQKNLSEMKIIWEFKLIKGKVNYTLAQALRLYTGRTAHRGSRGTALLFLDHGTKRG